MDAPRTPASPEPVSTAGAWLGLGVAVRAALCVVSGIAGLVVCGLVPLLVDWVGRSAEAGDAPPEFARLLGLLLELVTVLGPYTTIAGGAAIAIGLLMFAAAVALVAGSDRGRRAARVLLVADVVHSVAASVWLLVLWTGPLGDWNDRYLKTVTSLLDAAPLAEERMPVDLHATNLMNVVSLGVSLVFSVAIASVLCWLGGRPFARRWCGTDEPGTPVASGTGPR